MSVRFYKILLGVLLVHLLILRVVVGFSAPAPRLLATFTYEGALPADDMNGGQEALWQKDKNFDKIIDDHLEVPNQNQWVELRSPAKP